jgi:tetratricopeptide (TPR) repeat protein
MNQNWISLCVFAIIGWLVLNVAGFIIIFLHELMHALPAIYFTKRPATIYIGSYGEDIGPQFSIGKLRIRIKPRFSYLRSEGLCMHEAIPSDHKSIIVLLSGPVGTLVIASVLFPFVSDPAVYGVFKITVVIFFAFALISLVSNLYPRKLELDSTLYSDGQWILYIIKLKGANKHLFKATDFFEHNEFGKTIAELDKIDKVHLNDYLSSLYIQSYVELKQYEQLTAFKQNYLNPQSLESLTSYNCINLSFANIQLKEYDEALKLLNRAVELNEDYYALNNRGFVLNILGDYAAAKQDLNKACEIDPASAYAVTNRAYSNVKLGLLDEALVDINKSMELNDGNSYIYLVQGMYQLETGSPQNALANFERAKKLNSTTVLVDEYITLAKSRLIAAQA